MVRRRFAVRDLLLALLVVGAAAIVQLRAQLVVPATGTYGFGDNTFWQLGIGSANTSPNVSLPRAVVGVSLFSDLSTRRFHAAAVDAKGKVLTWGRNESLQLGRATTTTINFAPAAQIPDVVSLNQSATQVAAGGAHTLALMADGTVTSWGQNGNGQLGRSTSNVPGYAPALASIAAIAAGDSFSLALKTDGTLLAFGDNSRMQLGVAGPGGSTPVTVPGLSGIVAISAGGSHVLALDDQGHVWAWGWNQFGQAGQAAAMSVGPAMVAGLDNVIDIAAGGTHSVAVKADGTVWAWGQRGPLGSQQTGADAVVPEQVTTDGSTPLTGIDHVAAGDFMTLASGGGQMYGWGKNSLGQLGLAPVAGVTYATQVPMDVPVNDVVAGATFGFALTGLPDVTAAINASDTTVCAPPGSPTSVSVSLNGYSLLAPGKADIMLVLDESGSISAASFAQLTQFASSFVSSLDIAPDQSRVGIAMFSTDSRLIIAPHNNKTQVLNAISGIDQATGYTCIGCGLNEAREALANAPRPGASPFIIVVTDGANNRPGTQAQADAHLAAAIADAQAAATVVAIGIGSQVDTTELTNIASDVPGVETMFTSPDFDSLDVLVASLTTAITTPGANAVTVVLDVSASWQILGANTSSTGAMVQVTGQQIRFTAASMGSAGASFELEVQPLDGGTQPLFTSATYTDIEGHDVTIDNPSIDVTGCPATLVLAPAASTGPVGSPHTLDATLTDDFGNPIAGVAVRFEVTSGPSFGTVGANSTNAAGIATRSYSSGVAGVDVIEARLESDSTFRSNAVTREWRLPNAPPAVSAGSDQTIELIGSPTASFTLTGSATDDDQLSPLTYEWSENGAPIPGGGAASLSLSRPAGTFTFTLTAFDGEFSSSDTVSVAVVDPTPPSITPAIDGAAGANGWYVGPVTISWHTEDLETPITSPACSASTLALDGAGQASQCSAESGGGSSSASISVDIDQEPPVVTGPGNEIAEAASDAGAIVSYSGEASSDATSGIADFTCAPASGSMFPIGDSVVTCTATDAAGHSSASSSIVTVRDTTPPELTVPGNITEPGDQPGGRVVSWAVSATDAVGPVGTSCDRESGSLFAYGTTIVTCTANDAHGNSDSGTFTVTITDATPPELSATVNGTLGLNGWYTSDVAIDWTVSDPQSAISSSSGCDPAGVTSDGIASFTCTATSGGGTTTESVSVKRDATGPLLTTSSDIAADATGAGGANVTYPAATAVDPASGVAAVSCAPASGSLFPIGTSTVTCTAADNAGNSSTASFAIAVADTVPPAIASTTPSVSALSPPNHQMLPIAVSVAATDNLGTAPTCSITSVTSNEPQNGLGDGDTPNDWAITGALTVQLRAERSGKGNGRIYTINVRCTDAAGNATTSSTTVSVPRSQARR